MRKTQLGLIYASNNNFKEVFSKILEAGPIHNFKEQRSPLKASWINTPLGPLLAIADDAYLYLLEFVDGRGIEREVRELQIDTQSAIILGSSKPILSIQNELDLYFTGSLREFKTPLFLLGSSFQKQVWQALIGIPYGETRSYAEQAKIIAKPTAFRAVANANGVNQLAIIVPCHRIINSNGKLGGYGGGLERKQWLLQHEKQNQ